MFGFGLVYAVGLSTTANSLSIDALLAYSKNRGQSVNAVYTRTQNFTLDKCHYVPGVFLCRMKTAVTTLTGFTIDKARR